MDNKIRISPPVAGVLFAVLAAVIFSILNLVIRFSEAHLTVWHMMFGRSVFGVFFLILAARAANITLKGQRRATLFLLGITGTAGILCLTIALIKIPLFQALILFYTYPAVAALLSPLITNDRIGILDWLCILLAFAGTVLILWSGQAMGFSISPGHVAALGASAGLGTTMTLIRRVSDVNNSVTPIFYISAVGAVICFFPLLYSGSGFLVSVKGFWWICTIGLLAISAHIATNRALFFISSPKVGIIGMLEVVFGAVYGYLIFAETLGWSTLFGGTLIIIAGVGLVRSAAGSNP